MHFTKNPVWAPIQAFALILAIGLMVSMPPLEAADEPAARAEPQRFDIAAGPLGPALNRFASQAGLTLSFDADLTRGKTTPGLSGTFTAREALTRLLADTGLQARFTDADTVVLVAASGEESLAPILVEGGSGDITRDDGYVPARSVSATKTETPILETPQSVSVVNDTVIEDQGNRELEQALRNVTSIGRIANEGNVGGQNDITLRGFQTNRVFKNGFRFDNNGGPLSLANVDRVEVVKGPASILYGAVSPGGIVNVITKRPRARDELSLSAQLDEFGRAAVTVDAAGAVTAGGSLRHRTVLSRDEGDVFIDRNEVEDTLLSHSLTWLVTDRLTLDFHAEHAIDSGTFQFGLPFNGNEPDSRVPVDRFLGETFNHKETEDTLVQLKGSYLIGEASELRWHAGWHDTDLNAVALRPFGPNAGQVQPDDTVGRGFSLRAGDGNKERQFDIDFVSQQRFLGFDHELLVSVQYHDNEGDGGAPSGNNVDAPPVNVLDPQFNQVTAQELINDPDFRPFAPNAGSSTDQLNVVVQDGVWLTPRLKLLASLAYSDIEQRVLFPSFGLDQTNAGDELLPRGGLLYKLTPELSAYASYAESLEPNFGGNPDGEAFEPSQGEQFEVGLKKAWSDRGFVSLALYDLTQTNIPEPVGGGFSRLIGEVRSRGAELELSAALPLGLRLDGGYSFIDSEVLTDGNPNEGNSNANVPEHRASLWVAGDLLDSRARRIALGGGVFYEDERFVSSANDKFLDDYVTVDLMASHAWKLPDGSGLDLQLNLQNVFNERYFESGFVNAAQPGPSRTLLGTLTWEMN